MANPILRMLRGSNLEIFKFGLYLSFPIGWMYYFGTNLDQKFSIPDFWPTAEQSHKIPREKEDIKREVERIRVEIRERKLLREQEQQAVGEDGRALLGGQRGGVMERIAARSQDGEKG